jgi:hypothetical protein
MTRKRPTSKTCASMTSPLRLEAAVAIAHEPSHVVLDSIAHLIRQDRVGGSRFLRASISAEDEPRMAIDDPQGTQVGLLPFLPLSRAPDRR